MSSQTKILVVEDSVESFELIRQSLGNVAELIWARDLKTAHQFLNEKTFSLVLLDLGLPDGDGMAFCSVLQSSEKFSDLPIVLLTGRDSISDKVMGFSVGAEDYVTKPFNVLELRSRIEVKLRKIASRKAAAMFIRIHGLEIDRDMRTVRVAETDEQIDLTSKEFLLLIMFAGQPSKIFSRAAVIEHVWGPRVNVTDRIVDTHVSKLKKKLGSHSDIIETVHGSGYRLKATPTASGDRR